MEYEWDPAKAAANLRKHGVDFAAVAGFAWEAALTEPDDRDPWGEVRWCSTGFIGPGLFQVVWTERGSATRIISVRKATAKEARNYVAWTRSR